MNQLAKKFVAKHGSQDKPMEERKILQKIGELNIEQGTSAFSKFGCKNEGFVRGHGLQGRRAASRCVQADGYRG